MVREGNTTSEIERELRDLLSELPLVQLKALLSALKDDAEFEELLSAAQ